MWFSSRYCLLLKLFMQLRVLFFQLVPLVNMAASAVKVADTVNSTCYHVDGSCKAGCEAGYKASACKTRTLLFQL